MPKRKQRDAKAEVLREQGVLNPHPEDVDEPLFRERSFFDPRDLVQLRYEMLRAVSEDRRPVSEVTARFGCSRPTYYKARGDFEAEGVIGLLPRKRGPRRAHKLSAPVMEFINELLSGDPTLVASELVDRVRKRFRLSVHPRSVQRALEREKRGL